MSARAPSGQKGPPANNAPVKTEETSLHEQLQTIDWDSERQLVSSLAKLQELETKIHELRSLLPHRLLEPIAAIVNPVQSIPGHGSELPLSVTSTPTVPRNPRLLNLLLRKSTSEGVAEVENFKQLWLGPDMQPIWKRVDEKLVETKGSFPQAEAGVWQVDYAEILREMDEKARMGKEDKNGQGRREGDEEGRGGDTMDLDMPTTTTKSPGGSAAVFGSPDQDPKTVVQSFQSRSNPGFRLAITKNESMILVSLALAGLSFEIHQVLTTASEAAQVAKPESSLSSSSVQINMSTQAPADSKQANSLPEWRVSPRQRPGVLNGSSHLELAVVRQLNSRVRRWDLHYLLELILAYANLNSQPCMKCNRLTDSSAQLPIIRKLHVQNQNTTRTAEGMTAVDGNAKFAWDAYHERCI